MPDDESFNIEMVKNILMAMAKIRNEMKAWRDAEEETVGTQVFKIGESIRAFYLAAVYAPASFETLPLSRALLYRDTRFFFSTVKKYGFFPSPYSAVDSDDQHNDFAAFALEFSDLVCRYLERYDKRNVLADSARATARRAFDFLRDKQGFRETSTGVRWAGTTTHTLEVRGAKQFHTNTYFTALVVIALRHAMKSQALQLSEGEVKEVRDLIRKAGAWMIGQVDGGLFTGNEDRTLRSFFYTSWAMRAIAESYDVQGEEQRSFFRSFVPGYIRLLDTLMNEKQIAVKQEYLYVYSPDMEQQLPYEERSSWAGELLALLSIAEVPDVQAALEECGYSRVFDRLLRGIIAIRDLSRDLWYSGYPILSIHSYLVEAFLIMERGVPALGHKLVVTPALIQRAVRLTLEDGEVRKFLHQILQGHLAQLAEEKTKGEQMSEHLAEFSTKPEKEVEHKRRSRRRKT